MNKTNKLKKGNKLFLFMNREFRSSSLISILGFSFRSHFLLLKLSSFSSNLSIGSHFKTFSNSKTSLLTYILIFVKIQFSILPIFSAVLANDAGTIYLAKGQQYVLNFKYLSHFSVGNDQVLGTRYVKKNARFYIKAKMVGFSDLKVFFLNNKFIEYKVFVLSKTKYMAQYHLAQSLEQIGLKSKIIGSVIIPSGHIRELEDFITLQSLKMGHKNLILSKVTLDKNLRNKIYAKIYEQTLSSGINFIKCQELNLNINCSVAPYDKKSSLLKKLSQIYSITFSAYQEQAANFSIKLRLIKVEYSKDRRLDWQLNKIDQELKSLLSQGILYKKNSIFLQDTKASLSVVGEPSLLTKINQKSSISFGSEIPFQNQSLNNPSIQWKFAGIKLNSTLKRNDNELNLEYNIVFTSPSPGNTIISGSKQSGSLLIKENKHIQLFKIGFYVDGNLNTSVPFLNQIPLLKSLFSSYENNHLFQEIIGILYIQNKSV